MAPFSFDTTTIEGTQLTFTYYTPSLRGAAGDEANHGVLPHTNKGLQATYQKLGMSEAVNVQQYPFIPTTNGAKKPFSQLTAEETNLLAREGKWEVSANGALRYQAYAAEEGCKL